MENNLQRLGEFRQLKKEILWIFDISNPPPRQRTIFF